MRHGLLTALTLTGLGAAGVLLISSILALPAPPVDLSAAVAASLDASGVDHPVTAVLLNFRAFDTLLEVVVLLVALLGVHRVARPTTLPPVPRDPILDAAARVLTPPMLVTAVYLLWAGAYRPGGAFQAAAVAAAAGVLLALVGIAPRSLLPTLPVRLILVLGMTVFLVIAVAAGPVLLELAPGIAGTLILVIETALTVSLAFTLWAFYLCLAAPPTRDAQPDEGDAP